MSNKPPRNPGKRENITGEDREPKLGDNSRNATPKIGDLWIDLDSGNKFAITSIRHGEFTSTKNPDGSVSEEIKPPILTIKPLINGEWGPERHLLKLGENVFGSAGDE